MDRILILDFGGQYSQLIARRVREEHVFAEILPGRSFSEEQLRNTRYNGIIFSGGPRSVLEKDAPSCDPDLMKTGIPILGICYGMQLLACLAGGRVCSSSANREYGKTPVTFSDSPLFRDLPEENICWMSHTDQVCHVPSGFHVIARTGNCACAAMSCEERKLFGVQFHPEVSHTPCGRQILRNFLFSVCGCTPDWLLRDFTASAITRYREKLDGKKVLLALSGGVDSSVAAILLHKAVGQNLTCIFVDHGFLRKGEADAIEKTFRQQFDLKLIRVDARERFLKRLAGITNPERKRRLIGEEFIRVFEEESSKAGPFYALAQGTIYPDVIESGTGASAVIKSHHNVGGLPSVIAFQELIEPLRNLFKDEVREVGTILGLPGWLIHRQPFPGPGLAVRITGEVTEEKLLLLREADALFREELEKNCSDLPDQYFSVLTDTRAVGVKGDVRVYGYVLALRAVRTDDFMTAEWAKIPYDALETASSRITNEVPGISRVVYDISSKPPATVEWE